MPLHPALAEENVLDGDLRIMLQVAAESSDFSILEKRFEQAKMDDPFMQPYVKGEKGVKYYKPFAQTVAPKVIPALREALTEGACPEILLKFQDFEECRKGMEGIGDLGSPQDFIYALTSERYAKWSSALATMGFQSAFRTGSQQIVVTMAPRLLTLGDPDVTTDELQGAVSKEFWRSLEAIFGGRAFKEKLSEVLNQEELDELELDSVDADTVGRIRGILVKRAENAGSNGVVTARATLLLRDIEAVCELDDTAARIRRTRSMLRSRSRKARPNQEQIFLKYVEEDNLLQKVLLGSKVEHIQSNVKMVPNPMRGSRCEVDNIYRVMGEQRIVLVEAKAKGSVSRAQLYQMYETYRLKMPAGWAVDVVAVLMGTGKDSGVDTVDLVEVQFDDSVFLKITERLVALKPRVHWSWNFKRA